MRGLRWRAGALLVVGLLCGACSEPVPRLHVRLDAGPAVAPFDPPVHITVSGLPALGLVTMQARTADRQGPWVSSAQFRATAAGTLNLSAAVPVAGSYHVAVAGGLLWSLQPAFRSTAATQFYMSASRWGTSTNLGCRNACATSRWNTSPAPWPGCEPSPPSAGGGSS